MERILRNGKMILFDVKSLFTKVHLDETIAVILRKICDEIKIEKYIPRNCYSYAQNTYVAFNDVIYIRLDGAARGQHQDPC